jgi:hypothetical protein
MHNIFVHISANLEECATMAVMILEAMPAHDSPTWRAPNTEKHAFVLGKIWMHGTGLEKFGFAQ